MINCVNISCFVVEANVCSMIKDANAFEAFCKRLFAGVDSNKDGMLDRFDDKDVSSFEEFDYADGRVTLEGMKVNVIVINKTKNM